MPAESVLPAYTKEEFIGWLGVGFSLIHQGDLFLTLGEIIILKGDIVLFAGAVLKENPLQDNYALISVHLMFLDGRKPINISEIKKRGSICQLIGRIF